MPPDAINIRMLKREKKLAKGQWMYLVYDILAVRYM